MTVNILVVEDESIVAQDIKMTLEELGYIVPVIADSGELAIKNAAKFRPDLILMDIRLIGKMDGIEAAEIINQEFNIPIIYLTAHGDDETLARAKLTDPYGYLIKPFVEQDLRITLEIALYKHEIKQQLIEQKQWLSTILNSVGDGVLTTDINHQITYLNPMAEQLTGWTLSEAIGKPVTEVFKLINETTHQSLPSPIEQVLENGQMLTLPSHTLLVKKDGQAIAIGDNAAPIYEYKQTTSLSHNGDQCTGVVLVFRDITEYKLTTQKLHRQAFYDSLTNLPNRRWFQERLIDAIERVKRNSNYLFAVLFLDLDRFKVINDSLGHQMGDRLLNEVSRRLTHLLRSIDTVARFGGDEFAILLEDIHSRDDAIHVAQRINDSLNSPFIIDGKEVFTNSSIGIVLSSNGYLSMDNLIRDADIAMYRAKAKGRACYAIFDPVVAQEIISASRLENDLKGAIEKEELTLYYQPIFDLETQMIQGVEALVRWQHPQNGLISPQFFIPIAEETGYILAIDNWVLETACHQMKQWLTLGSNCQFSKVSINISSYQCLQKNLTQKIRKILSTTGLNPSNITLEITETALIQDPDSAIVILNQLKDLGIILSLDDFGTGYSSLSYLHYFPVDTLKIDRSFISNLSKNKEGLEIVKTIINLGRNLNMDIVAEGIETDEQLKLLKQLNCQYGQGYLFSKPLAVDDMNQLINS
ncbi:hypothetical protein cce_1877 [Crocosphaera subtropica ATCC 51142]|uniref:Two-component response regulator n=1 Tax=Crocosphaera subtropica (strain ATCC 51142 / BH68) TaxID=43989 RepID=B1X0D8_CROS5|nr:GGDEF domain-containing response regulator [Crocosphaera subtropica]ACB51227.1 hypothetical protein cce_1877 [Crocosphaera subtropica ATCC 51142]